MKKEFRVKDNREFSTIINTGKKLINDDFAIYYVDKKLSHGRVGITVSKKIGNAVIRSTTRRKIRSIVDTTLDLNIISKDIIIIARGQINNKTYQELLISFKQIIESIQI